MGRGLSKKIFTLVAAALMTVSVIPTHSMATAGEADTTEKVQGQAVSPEAVEQSDAAKGEAKAAEEQENSNAPSVKVNAAESDFEFDAATGTITAYKGAGGAVVVPETIDGVKVKALAGDVNNRDKCPFAGNKSITSIKLPSGITRINEYSFSECISLKSVTMSNNVTHIGQHAFHGTAIETINIPSSVTSFSENYGSVFLACKYLKSIKVDSGNKKYCSIDGVLYNKDKTVLIRYPEGKAGSTYKIPDTVKTILWGAFDDCVALKSITIPEGVTKIGDAFSDCTSLTSLTFPSTLTEFTDDFIVTGCSALKDIYFKGNAPKVPKFFNFSLDFILYEDKINIYYDENATGFTTPEWLGMPCYPISYTNTDNNVGDNKEPQYPSYTTPSGDSIKFASLTKEEQETAKQKIFNKLSITSLAAGQDIFHYNITLINKETGEAYTKDNFPEEGVTVTIPFPENMDKNSHNYRVFHFPQGVDGEITEVAPLTITDDGIQFHVNGLSPFSLVAEKKANTSYAVSPKTGDNGNKYVIFVLMSASFIALSVMIAVKKLRTEK